MHSLRLLSAIFLLLLASCSTAYYSGMERLGYQKRDILVSRVKKAKDSQVEAKEQFESALDEFIAVTGYSGRDLERNYKRIERAYAKSKSRAEEVKDRNDAVARTGKALFKEWGKEISEYQNKEFRADSERQRAESQVRFNELMTAMRRAEAKLDPVLREFHDHVLYLKHNLNAQAVAALKGRVSDVNVDVARLIREMERSITEADSFIKQMR